MIKWEYINKQLKNHISFLIFAFLLNGGFQLLILSIFSTSEFLGFFQGLMNRMPPQVQMFMSEEFIAQFTIGGIAAFGYNHPIVIILFSIMAVMLPTRHISGEIEDGSLEILLSLPVKRSSIILSLWIFSFIAQLFILVGCWLGTLWGLQSHSGDINFPFIKIVLIGINLLLLMLAINGYSFLLASFSNEGEKVTLRAAGLTLIFYFLNYAVKIWPEIQSLKYFTIFNYYNPQKLMSGEFNIFRNFAFLFIVALFCILIAFRRFQKRDISA